MNNYYGGGFNPYQFQQNPMYQPQRFQTPDQQYVNQQQMQQPVQPTVPVTSTYKSLGLQGKSVDSVDVVKATEIPLDGTISYFPLTDGSMIITKQLMMDGTSKIVTYKPVEEDTPTEQTIPKYITEEDLNEKLKGIGTDKDLKDDIKSLKKQVKDLTYDFQKINEKLEESED